MTKCTICSSPNRAEIEAALVKGTPLRQIEAKYRRAKSSIDRHARQCVPQAIAKAAEAREIKLADVLLEEVEALHSTAKEILHEARMSKDGVLALKAIAQARRNIELAARLTGKLEPEQETRKGVQLEEFLAIYRRVVVQE